RVGGEVPAVRLEVVGQPEVDDAGLNKSAAVAVIDFEDALHTRQSDHDAAANGQTAAGQAGAGAARQERHVELVAQLNDADDLLRRGREDDDVGLVLLDGVAVALVDEQVAGRGDEAVAADDFAEAVDQRDYGRHYS